ncbi:unnamed protein product, partial [marine sediment metagenome]
AQAEKIVFSFGFRSKDVISVLPSLNDIAKGYPLRYVVIANPESDLSGLYEAKKKYNFIDLRTRALPLDELYDYLYASDVLLIHRESSQKYKAVVSSSVCQLLGSGCPILFHQSNYVELHGSEIIKYRDFEDMKTKLIELFQGKLFNLTRIKDFLKNYEAERIAERFIKLFEKLMEARERRRK